MAGISTVLQRDAIPACILPTVQNLAWVEIVKKSPTDTEIEQKRAELIADDKKSLTYSDIEEAIVECRSGVSRAALASAVKSHDAIYTCATLLNIISTYRSPIIEGRLQ